MIRLLIKVAFCTHALLLISMIGLADAGQAQHYWPFMYRIPAGDKVGHFIMFGLLAFLANAAMNGTRIRFGAAAILKGSLIVAVPTVLEEFSQIFIRCRTFDLLDLTADAVGITLGGWLAVLLLRQLANWELARATARQTPVSVPVPSSD